MNGFYNFCSKGFTNEILFASEQEFTAAVNRLAVCTELNRLHDKAVSIIVYCLMDNHFHLLLKGKEEDCMYFITNFKRLTVYWTARHRGRPLCERIETDCWHVRPDKLAEKIIYYLRNPVAAGMRVVPHGYRWSSSQLMFTDKTSQIKGAKKVSDYSTRAIRRMTGSHCPLPGEWLVLNGEQIWPGHFVDYTTAEKQFPSIGSFMFELNNRKNEQEAEEEKTRYSIPDSEVKLRAVQLSIEYFRKDRISLCSTNERQTIARVIMQEMGCSEKQLRRVLRLQEST